MRPAILALITVLLLLSGAAMPASCEAQVISNFFKSKPKPTIHRSPKGSFSLKLPVSAHEIKISESQDELQEQVTVNDKIGMQLSVLVTHRTPESKTWLKEGMRNFPPKSGTKQPGVPPK